MGFLALPTELVVQILLNLPLPDLFACLRTSRFLFEDIRNSVAVQYWIETQIACVEDNPKSDLDLSERLAMLRHREHAWAHFDYNFITPIHVHHKSSGIYDLTPYIYLLGDTTELDRSINSAVKYVRLPSSTPSQEPPWSEINIGRPIVDFATAINEHNLIALVTSLPDKSDPTAVNFLLEIVLMNFSTGAYHDMAQRPIISVNDSTVFQGPPSVNIEIVGENMGLVVLYPRDVYGTRNLFYLYDWKRGTRKMEPVKSHNIGLVFLSEVVILHPCQDKESLDLYLIPPSSENKKAQLVHSFLLPAIDVGHYIGGMSCRGEPNPTGMSSNAMSSSTSRPFNSTSDDSIIIITLDIQSHVGLLFWPFSLIVHRRSLLAYAPPMTTCGSKILKITEWEKWGPSATRWFNADEVPTSWITTTSGHCYVQIASNAHDEPAPIHILDFNPYHVRRLQALGGSCSSAISEIRLVTGFDEDSFSEHDVFVEDVRSTLPYVECSSRELFTYNAVLIEEERIIGIRSNSNSDAVEAFDVIHFG